MTGERTDRRGLVGVLTLGVVVGLTFALRVPAGLPYDEPSYWATTQYYAFHHRMPVLGHPGVTYEAQHPPLGFVLAALGRGVGTVFSSGTWLPLVFSRAVGGLELLAAVVVLDRILRRTVRSGMARLVALVIFAAAPMFVAMSWSVQNDSLSLLMAFVALELMLVFDEREGPALTPVSGLVVGLIVGLGILTKITLFWLIPVFAVWLVWRGHRQAGAVVRTLVAFGGGVALTCGWWFVRDLVVYGHLIGSTDLAGSHFGPAGFHGLATIRALGEGMVTYLWLPTEYYRNLIRAPGPLRVVVAGLVVGVVGSALVLVASDRRARSRSMDPRRVDPDRPRPGPVSSRLAAAGAHRPVRGGGLGRALRDHDLVPGPRRVRGPAPVVQRGGLGGGSVGRCPFGADPGGHAGPRGGGGGDARCVDAVGGARHRTDGFVVAVDGAGLPGGSPTLRGCPARSHHRPRRTRSAPRRSWCATPTAASTPTTPRAFNS